jgi:methylmalonyl-CoA/ethylmalonyl-CoA epimerase
MKEEKPFSKKLLHVGVVVRDIEKTIKRLESLGIGPFKNDPPPTFAGKMLFRGRPYDPNIKVFKAGIGDIELELFENVKGDSPWKEFLDSKGEGIHHIGFAETDIENEVARLTGLGAKVLNSVRVQGGGGADYLDVGIGGLIIELEQK